jgi:GNAT superfamily N-acetyltransferase
MALPAFIDISDLAPGDIPQLERLPDSIALSRIRSTAEPDFDAALSMLEAEFASKNEMESRSVIEGRLSKNASPVGSSSMRYELCLLKRDGTPLAVCDHTEIYVRDGDFERIVVHASHALIAEKWRGKGLAALLRAVLVRTAREFARELGKPGIKIAILAEMDPFDPLSTANARRRHSFGKAGFKVVGVPIGYLQPDFRTPNAIDADTYGSRPVPLEIVIRLVGDENADALPAADLQHMIAALYRMYAREISPREMAPCLAWFYAFARRKEHAYPLIPPTNPASIPAKS